MKFENTKTFDAALQRADEKIIEYNENNVSLRDNPDDYIDKERNISYWRGVKRGIEHSRHRITTREIQGGIFHIFYDTSWGGEFVECGCIEDLYEYIAYKQIYCNAVVIKVNRLQYDGTRPKVAFRTNKDFKHICKQMQLQKERENG